MALTMVLSELRALTSHAIKAEESRKMPSKPTSSSSPTSLKSVAGASHRIIVSCVPSYVFVGNTPS